MNVDLVAKTQPGEPVLIVEVKTYSLESGSVVFAEFLDHLESSPESVLFGILVDPVLIRVYRRESLMHTRPIKAFNTIEVLSYYSADFTGEKLPYGSWQIFHRLLITFVQAWLRDLAIQWKAGDTPGRDEIRAMGLLARLEGSSVFDQELAVADPVR